MLMNSQVDDDLAVSDASLPENSTWVFTGVSGSSLESPTTLHAKWAVRVSDRKSTTQGRGT